MDFKGSHAPARANHEEVGVLSADRWGIGSLVMIGAFMGTGAFLLFRWAGTRNGFSLGLALLLLGGGVVVFVVKAAENIERVEFRGYDPVGKTGVVTVALGRGALGSVKVDGLHWSATSKEHLEIGEPVLVVSREGLHISVRKLRTQPAA
ncbi:MAG: NfeD family protein [Thaumarchaeota archaeon]|nr:NfeD family protein [Nitrososphaerota archaeon]